MTERGIIFVNPYSGSGNDPDDLAGMFDGHDVVECDPADLASRVHKAVEAIAKPTFVGVAGGDGSIRSVTGVLLSVSPSTPLLAVPAGTRNHFARDVGIETITDAVDAARSGITKTIDVGLVNDECFVNNSSIGVYPRLVAHREARESRLPKGVAAIVAAWHQFRHGHRTSVRIDGSPANVWAVFVGNNCYGASLRELTGRERLDEGVLDVRVVHADRRLSRLRVAGAVLFGRVEHSPLIDRLKCTSVELDLGGATRVALDGEVETMESPLRFRSHSGALAVLISGEHP